MIIISPMVVETQNMNNLFVEEPSLGKGDEAIPLFII